MLMVQGLSAFIVWIAFAIFQWQRAEYLFAKVNKLDPKKRTTQATLLLFGGAAVLLLGLYGVYNLGGFLENGMTYWAWAAVAALGVVFVHMQSLAAILLLSTARIEVTQGPVATSTQQEEEVYVKND